MYNEEILQAVRDYAQRIISENEFRIELRKAVENVVQIARDCGTKADTVIINPNVIKFNISPTGNRAAYLGLKTFFSKDLPDNAAFVVTEIGEELTEIIYKARRAEITVLIEMLYAELKKNKNNMAIKRLICDLEGQDD